MAAGREDNAIAGRSAPLARIANPMPIDNSWERAGSDIRGDADGLPSRLTFALSGIGAGGSERVVSMLCNHFAARGCCVRLACFELPGTKPFYDLDASVTVVYLGLSSQPRKLVTGMAVMVRRFVRLKRELANNRPDLAIGFLTRPNILMALAADRLGIPVVISERNNPFRQKNGKVWELLRHFAYGRADALVTITHGARTFFKSNPSRLDIVIPNHADLPEVPCAFDPEGRNLVAVGRFVDQKGFDLLLHAFAKIAPRFADWHLTIWGQGPLEAELLALRNALNLEARVSFPGVSDQPGSWMNHADVFVLSSRFEGWGLVVGEAMAAGIPVVAFDCPFGPGEMIEHMATGLLAADLDPDALADALEVAMSNPQLREELGKAGRKSMTKFQRDHVLAKWESLLREVAAPKG